MCLAIPVKIIKIGADGRAEVESGGLQQSCILDLCPKASVGDYVLMHAGYAIEVVAPEEAAETLSLIKEMEDLVCADEAGARA
ncbi:MAG: HypC/HybG/HupF family hydrogenase formation chaperone [Coriobacteriales bacterium]|jgi:hydrogenase expression/formation protein HypC|nr:HypC/HybG/HupF family hydrogenase formation chaperone [Coriobacteriales bacterium]